MYAPIRAGTRGGQGDFKWEDVKNDKDRENYLGHSLHASVGRWQANKDITWYNKEGKQAAEERRAELRKIKEAEEDALSIALGFAPAPRNRDPVEEPTSAADPLPSQSNLSALEQKTKEAEKAARKAEREQRRIEKDIRRTEKEARRDEKERSRRRRQDDHRPISTDRKFDYNRNDRSRNDRSRSRSLDRHDQRDRDRRYRSPDSRDLIRDRSTTANHRRDLDQGKETSDFDAYSRRPDRRSASPASLPQVPRSGLTRPRHRSRSGSR